MFQALRVDIVFVAFATFQAILFAVGRTRAIRSRIHRPTRFEGGKLLRTTLKMFRFGEKVITVDVMVGSCAFGILKEGHKK